MLLNFPFFSSFEWASAQRFAAKPEMFKPLNLLCHGKAKTGWSFDMSAIAPAEN